MSMIYNVKDLIDILAQWDPNIKADVTAERDVSKMAGGIDILEVRIRFKKYRKEDQIGHCSRRSW